MDEQEFQIILDTVYDLLKCEGIDEAAELIRTNPARWDKFCEDYDHDPFYGPPPSHWKFFIDIPANDYVRIETQRNQIEKKIAERIQTVMESGYSTRDSYSVTIVPRRTENQEWRAASHEIEKKTISTTRTIAKTLDSTSMLEEIDQIEKNITSHPATAILAAATLIESCCKAILKKRGVTYPEKATLSDLCTLLTNELHLTPNHIPHSAKAADIIRRILGNLIDLTGNLANLRNKYSIAHGTDGNPRGLQPRHARLAALSAITFITFVTDTYYQQKRAKKIEATP